MLILSVHSDKIHNTNKPVQQSTEKKMPDEQDAGQELEAIATAERDPHLQW